MHLLELPPELFTPILEHLEGDKAALFNLTLTSQTVFAHSQPFLYRSFTFDENSPSYIKFLASIIQKPNLARHLRVFDTNVADLYLTDQAWKLTCVALPLMVNLRELVICLLGQPMQEILKECSFQLEKLTWVSISQESRLPSSIAGQHSLKELQWSCHRRLSIPKTVCPNLHTLRGSYHLLSNFMVGRNIAHFIWEPEKYIYTHAPLDRSSEWDSDDSAMAHLAKPLSDLTILSVHWRRNYSPLRLFSDHLSSVRFVEVCTLIEDDLEALATLPKLEYLSIRSTQCCRNPVRFEEHSDTTKYLFDRSQSLVIFDLGFAPDGLGPPAYKRWIKGVLQDHLLWGREDQFPSLHIGLLNTGAFPPLF